MAVRFKEFETAGSRGAAQRLRVLIVEDDALIALDAEDALTAAGYEIVGWANRCSTALELAQLKRPDLVVMDVSLAGRRDGIETALLLRRDFDIPTLFSTAQVSQELRERAENARPVGWLVKPVERQELVNAVELAQSRTAAD